MLHILARFVTSFAWFNWLIGEGEPRYPQLLAEKVSFFRLVLFDLIGSLFLTLIIVGFLRPVGGRFFTINIKGTSKLDRYSPDLTLAWMLVCGGEIAVAVLHVRH